MRNIADSKSPESGFVLAVAAILTFLVGGAVASASLLALQEYRLSVHSSGYAKALHSAESGVDLACQEFYKHIKGMSDAWSGWTLSGTNLSLGWINLTNSASPAFESSFYVSVNTNTFTITSAGRIDVATFPMPVERVIEITIQPVEQSPFTYGILAKNLIEISGNVLMDSFDSGDPSKSTGGHYDPAKAGFNATLVTVLTDEPSFKGSGDSAIHGDVAVGPGGSFDLGGGFTITGDQTYDGAAEFPDVTVPFSTAFTDPAIESEKTFVVAGSMDVSVLKINIGGSDDLTITGAGTFRIYVEEDISVGGDAAIRLVPNPPGADLVVEFYANKTVNISGEGIVNGTAKASKFSILGTENCVDINYSGNAQYIGTMYAPDAEIKVSGYGGITGALVARKITYSGNGAFHFDESLAGSQDPNKVFRSVRWVEL